MLKIMQDAHSRVFDIDLVKFGPFEPDEISISIGGETIRVFDVPPSTTRPPRVNPDGSKTYKWAYGNDTYWLEMSLAGDVKMSVCVRGSFASLAPLGGKPANLTATPVGGAPVTVGLGAPQIAVPTFAMWQ